MSELINFIETSCKDTFNEIKYDQKMKLEREAVFATQLLSDNEYALGVARGNKQSLIDAVNNVAAIGLSLNPSLKYCYLVPRRVGKVTKICLDISYQGFMKLLTDSANIEHFVSDIVYENDTFELTGMTTQPIHKCNPFSKERENIVGAYCVAKTYTGDYLTTTMQIDEIFQIRNSSESYKNESSRKYSPWVRYEGEMIKKTVIRRAYKMLPKTDVNDRIEKAIETSDYAQNIDFKTDFDHLQDGLKQDMIEMDSRSPEEKDINSSEYVFIQGKFRGKKLCEIDQDDLEKRVNYLDKQGDKLKGWQVQELEIITNYVMDIETKEL